MRETQEVQREVQDIARETKGRTGSEFTIVIAYERVTDAIGEQHARCVVGACLPDRDVLRKVLLNTIDMMASPTSVFVGTGAEPPVPKGAN